MNNFLPKNFNFDYPIKLAGQVLAGKEYRCTNPVGCGGEGLGFRDRESAAEYRVNKLCQNCQDKIFGVE